MKKKILIISIAVALFLIVTGIVTNYIDGDRVTTNNEPRYCIKIISSDGSKVTYWGLGYKVVRYVGVSPSSPYQNNIGVKMGNWFMKYELPVDSEYNKEQNEKIISIDDFYNTKLTKERDIRILNKEYNLFDAQKDNCFVIGAMVHNDNLYVEFMNNYKNKQLSFIRVAQNTAGGDLFLIDILYYENDNKLYVVKDNTRDKFPTEEDEKLTFKQFENITEYKYNGHLYWVLYNGEINEETFNSEKVFVITTIN